MKITVFQEADGFHWDIVSEAKKRGFLDARGRAYPTRSQARKAAREATGQLQINREKHQNTKTT